MGSFAERIRARALDDRPAVLFEDQRWTYREWVAQCATRAAFFDSSRTEGPPHIGVLLDNVPDFTMWLGAAALMGATVVGVNPTRRGVELQRDITYSDCQLIITSDSYAPLLEGLDLGSASKPGRILNIDEAGYAEALAPFAGAPVPVVDVDPATQLLLLFTSGTSGAPKAVICSQGRLDRISATIVDACALVPSDVAYLSMPLFHSNCLFTGWGPAIVSGCGAALRPKFSPTAFVPDVRRYGATYFTYVGKPLAYVLAQAPHPDDHDVPLTRGFGNEGSEADLARFTERFDCPLTDGYGSTETGVSINRVAGMPAGSLGVAADTVKILHPETVHECPRARFDEHGRLLNAEECTGEIVNTAGAAGFEGYWNNDEAQAERVRGAAYWSGDLGYRDEAGYFYFAGRSAEWLRVDGENFAAAPVERIISRFPNLVLAAVYAVPDALVGDQVMAAIQLGPSVAFDADAFTAFIDAQPDLGPKWKPRFVRVVDDFPMTRTNKVLKRDLARQRWNGPDPLWWRPPGQQRFTSFTAAHATALENQLG